MTDTIPRISIVETLANQQWIIQPVPVYLLAVAVTVGFWIGDVFDRNFGKKAGKAGRVI